MPLKSPRALLGNKIINFVCIVRGVPDGETEGDAWGGLRQALPGVPGEVRPETGNTAFYAVILVIILSLLKIITYLLLWLAVAIPSSFLLRASKTADFFHPIVQSSSVLPNETIH